MGRFKLWKTGVCLHQGIPVTVGRCLGLFSPRTASASYGAIVVCLPVNRIDRVCNLACGKGRHCNCCSIHLHRACNLVTWFLIQLGPPISSFIILYFHSSGHDIDEIKNKLQNLLDELMHEQRKIN